MWPTSLILRNMIVPLVSYKQRAPNSVGSINLLSWEKAWRIMETHLHGTKHGDDSNTSEADKVTYP